jgi:alkylation response protein AidB-like acyl-CoA dehydrogenase
VSAVTEADVEHLSELRDVARNVLAKESPTGRVRVVAEEGSGVDEALWQLLVDLGWTGLWVPEEHGGAGIHREAMSVILEELGRCVAGGPFLSTALLGAAALGASAHPARGEHLAAIAAGTRRTALALARPHSDRRGALVVARTAGLRTTLTGSCPFVPDAGTADLLVVHAVTDDGDDRLYLVDAGRAGVSVTAVPTVDQTRRLSQIDLDVVVDDADLLVEPTATDSVLELLVRVSAIGLAADSAGGARRVLELAVEYAKDRIQFGRAIGSFQAIKHRCADMYLRVEGAATAVALAVAAEDAGGHDPAAASIAKSYAGDAYVHVAHDAILTHGAIGAMWEHDLHLYLKRAKLNEALYGSSSWHRRRIVDAVRSVR